jgi:Uma2 family endonuclease
VVTAVPQPPSRLLTIAEYAALGETDTGYMELQEGRLLMSPSSQPDHNFASLELATQLRPQLPDHLEVLQALDIDLGLAPPDHPGFSRRSDLLVISRAARQRVRREGGLIRTSELTMVVEIVSPDSRRTDNAIKRDEYCDAGIPYYWLIDIDPPISVLACRLIEEFGYLEIGNSTGRFTTNEPFPITVDLNRLV